jgi:hypothetical protein
MKRASLVAVALLLMLVGSAAAASKVYYETPFGKVVYKPKRIEFSDLTLSRIHWRHWNSRRAYGRGRARINTCNPSCAAGNIVHGRSRLTMFKRHEQSGKRFYGCMTGVSRAEGKKYRVAWPPGCAG